MPSREETGRIPRNKWLQQLLQTPTPPTPPQLKSSSQGQVASSSSSSQPARSVVLVALLEGNPGSQVSREHTSPTEPKPESGVQLLATLKPKKRRAGGKESWLYFRGQQPGGRGLLTKASSSTLTISRQELLWREGGMGPQAEIAQSALAVMKLVLQ